MRYVDEYRAPEQVLQLIGHLKTRAARLDYTKEKPLRIMEVCGGHTHAIFKFGLDQLLPENIEFIHGPGCPVCVLPMGRIDSCIEIASRPDVIFCTFGDAMRVPGKNGSLLQAKARGADIRIVYSPMDALTLAADNPARKVVFLAWGLKPPCPPPPSRCSRRKRAASITFSSSASTLRSSPPCAACWKRQATALTPFWHRATSAW